MKTRIPLLAASCFLTHSAQAYQLVDSADFSLSLWGRGQLLGIGENVPQENPRDHDRIYLYLEQARLGFNGKVSDYSFYTELSLGGEDVTTSSGVALTLLEMRFDVPLFEGTFLRVGEYKVPYGREYLADDGAMLFAHRSLSNMGFYLGRDVGLGMATRQDSFSAALGVYTGGSRDIPERYLPEDLGVPVLAVRAGYDSSRDSVFANRPAGVFNLDHFEAATYVSTAYMEDTIIGHSTVLNLRPADRNLLIDPNWNPFMAQSPFAKTKLLEAALDGVVRAPVGGYVVSGEAELNAGVAVNDYGTVRMYGGRLQGAAARKPWEYALRYAVLAPDPGFAAGAQTKFAAGFGAVPITPSGEPFHEISPAVTYYFRDWSKLIIQGSVFVNVPVAHEAGIGSYVVTEQPDQVTVPITSATAGSKVTGFIDRETVTEAQVMWQLSF